MEQEKVDENEYAFIFDDPGKYAISREMLQFHQVPCTFLMVMLLDSKGQVPGSLVVSTG